jgi:3-oxoadipate enol-lactonase
MKFKAVRGNVFHTDFKLVNNRPVIVFVNSLGCDFRIWDVIIERIKGKYSILRYDSRGQGLSGEGEPPYSMRDHALDLQGLIDAFHEPGTPLVICGLSIGGQIVMEYALDSLCRADGIILCDTAPRIGSAERYEARIKTIRNGGMKSFAAAQMPRWFSRSFLTSHPEAVRGMYAMLTRQPLEGYIGSCRAIAGSDYQNRLRDIHLPALCIAGSEDESTPPETVMELAENLPRGVYREIPGAGHLPCIEAPDEFAAVISGFMEDLF